MDAKKHNEFQKCLQEMPSRVVSFFRERTNLFAILALAPLILVAYFGFVKRGDVVTWIIPFYGFLLLYIKREKLADFSEASSAFRIAGLIVIAFSGFAYYVVVRIHPPAQFYGEANYTLHLVGLFLVFFELRALKEAFSSLFLIAGATVIPFLGVELESFLWPSIPFFVKIIGLILHVFNIPATLIGSNTFTLTPLHSSAISMTVGPACIGIYGVLTFSILIMVTLIEDPSSSLRTKLLWAIGGAIGTFLINIIRVSSIFVVIYYFGYENWPAIHAPIGYVLFLTWVGVFFVVFSKKQTIGNAFQSLFRKLRADALPTSS